MLEELGHEGIVADPSFAPMYGMRTRRVKTDVRDARALAEACRSGVYRLAHRRSERQRRVTARIVFDKFHILRHFADAFDEVRRSEYRRLAGKDRAFIEGQRYTLLSSRENLSHDGRANLRRLLRANKRLNVAYLLKESFGQLWSYQPYLKFAKLIDQHWDGIASYCRPEKR